MHDLSSHAAAVFTINSGVGFEALFHLKPVVTFGHAEYDAVTVHGHPDEIERAWNACRSLEPADLAARYGKFVDWFFSTHAVDLSLPVDSLKRLDEIAVAVRKEVFDEI